jgi:hypothetical protein
MFGIKNDDEVEVEAPTLAEVCVLMGARSDEIVDVSQTRKGTIIRHRDGTTYIVVPPGKTDALGRSGLMYLTPSPRYAGDFPVYGRSREDVIASARAVLEQERQARG